jgi:hypothetical protein
MIIEIQDQDIILLNQHLQMYPNIYYLIKIDEIHKIDEIYSFLFYFYFIFIQFILSILYINSI